MGYSNNDFNSFDTTEKESKRPFIIVILLGIVIICTIFAITFKLVDNKNKERTKEEISSLVFDNLETKIKEGKPVDLTEYNTVLTKPSIKKLENLQKEESKNTFLTNLQSKIQEETGKETELELVASKFYKSKNPVPTVTYLGVDIAYNKNGVVGISYPNEIDKEDLQKVLTLLGDDLNSLSEEVKGTETIKKSKGTTYYE